MKKKLAMVIAAGVMAISLLTACGGGSDSSGAAAETTEEMTEETAEETEEEVAEEPEEEAGSEDSEAADAAGEVSYVDGYYANDGNGSDFIVAFYEGAAGDVAYINDGTNEAFAEYTVENAETAEGDPYYLITIGNARLGYVVDGDTYYIIDEEGNTYEAAKLSEEEANGIYAALKEAGN